MVGSCSTLSHGNHRCGVIRGAADGAPAGCGALVRRVVERPAAARSRRDAGCRGPRDRRAGGGGDPRRRFGRAGAGRGSYANGGGVRSGDTHTDARRCDGNSDDRGDARADADADREPDTRADGVARAGDRKYRGARLAVRASGRLRLRAAPNPADSASTLPSAPASSTGRLGRRCTCRKARRPPSGTT